MTTIAPCASCGNSIKIYQKNGTWKSFKSRVHRTYCNHPVHKACFDKINQCVHCHISPWVKLDVVKPIKSEPWTKNDVALLAMLVTSFVLCMSLSFYCFYPDLKTGFNRGK